MTKQHWVWTAASAMVLSASAGAQAAGPPLASQGTFNGSNGAFFGYSVAVDGDMAVVGAIDSNASGVNSGAAYVYTRNNGAWAVQATLTEGGTPTSGDQFGYVVAISGPTVLVGSALTNVVYVFTRSGTTWTQQAVISDAVSSPTSGDCFGCAVALSGTTAIIGAPGANANAGAAFIYGQSGSTWQLQTGGSFTTQSVAGDAFGFSVALDPAGDTALVGAYAASNLAGAAYAYVNPGTGWASSPVLTASGQPGDELGYAVALGAGTMLIGAPTHTGNGAVYPFALTAGTWSGQSPLASPDPSGHDYFGAAVGLNGNLGVIGAYERTGSVGPGAAYVFSNSGSSWGAAPVQELLAPAAGQYFGYSVAVSQSTVPTVVVGAYGAPSHSDSGTVYIYAPQTVSAPALGSWGKTWTLTLLLAALGAFASPRARKVMAI